MLCFDFILKKEAEEDRSAAGSSVTIVEVVAAIIYCKVNKIDNNMHFSYEDIHMKIISYSNKIKVWFYRGLKIKDR
jgi:hypothetical protein